MAGGPTTPELVAAVTAAGALGSFGLAYSTPEQIHDQCRSYHQLISKLEFAPDCGWNANFFVFPEVVEPVPSQIDKAIEHLEPLARRVSVDATDLKHDTHLPRLDDQIQAALEHQPSLVSLHLGIPEADIINTIHSANCFVALSATSLEEAMAAQTAGADFIVAQGYEAGGHRGVFNPEVDDDMLSSVELVKLLSAKCDVPVIAAGGIMDGQDIAAMINHGADAVQMGSAFLTVDECGSCSTYRAAIKMMGDRETRVTRGFSGRPARGIRNLFIESSEAAEVLPFPWQNSLTGALRKAAGGAQEYELMSLWAGTNFSRARNCSAAQLIDELQRELQATSHQ